MIKIDKPEFNVQEVYNVCVNTVSDEILRQNLSNCSEVIRVAEQDFDEKFARNEIYTIPQNSIIISPIETEQMKTLYTYRLVQKEEGRSYYNKLISNVPYGLCPICSVRIADTLDHYLPKSKYPIYAITPLNLIPACTNCNKDKKIDFPTSSDNQLLSPYYDNIEQESWLAAKVLRTDPLSFEYYVEPPELWDNILKKRVANNFDCYNLNILYSSHACQELRGLTKTLKRKRDISIEEVKFYLDEAHHDTLELGINSWKAVFYKALLNDDWFCNEGINQL